MNESKRVFKWWWAWNPETVENWLEEMEAEGWHLVKVQQAVTRFYFEKGQPRQIRYCIDYQNKKDSNYMSIFQDTGWEYIYESSGWYLWRMPYTGTRPEIYTDLDSLIERNNRLSGVFVVLITTQIPIMTAITNTIWKYPYILILYVILFGILIYSLVRMTSATNKMKKNRDALK